MKEIQLKKHKREDFAIADKLTIRYRLTIFLRFSLSFRECEFKVFNEIGKYLVGTSKIMSTEIFAI